MSTAIQTYFLAPPKNLPAPIPTIDVIETCPNILSKTGGRKVVCVGDHFVVKFGTSVEALEGQTMLYIRDTTSVTLPKVYALFTDNNTTKTYIVMERIRGPTLLSQWPKLSRTQKGQIAAQIKRNIDQLRDLPSPGYFGSYGRQALRDTIFWTGLDTPVSISGPFDSQEQLNNGLVLQYIMVADGNPRLEQRARFYKRALSAVFYNHHPTFTHGDLQRKNIMLIEKTAQDGPISRSSDNENQDYDVVIIDWETSGWYPEYWEYCSASWGIRWDDDWDEWLEQIVRPYFVEYSWVKMFRDELWS